MGSPKFYDTGTGCCLKQSCYYAGTGFRLALLPEPVIKTELTFTRPCDSLGPVHSPKGLARARESSIVDVNKYPDWTKAGRAGPLV